MPFLNETGEVVHSLAKWKRYALGKYGFRAGQGLVTNMNAIRRDEELDNLHSIYVDQWDWERVITERQRTLDFLQDTVHDIVDAVCGTADELRWKFPALKKIALSRDVAFITAQQLEDKYPGLDAERAGERLCEGAPHRLHHADRRQAEKRRPPTTAAPPTTTTGR